jgi:initiation factor 1A
MPNQKGGKNYKKSKHAAAQKATLFLPEADQIFGRVIRNLGQRRMLVFSNDNKIRMCHIRGSMRRGSSWITVGDIVLITRRDFEKAPETREEYENADIISRYEKDLHSDLKKIPGINPKLFMQIESVDSKLFNEIITKKFEELKPEDDTGIEFTESSEDEEEDEEGKKEEGGELKRKKGIKGWKEERAKQDKTEVDSSTFEREDGDIDIDAI